MPRTVRKMCHHVDECRRHGLKLTEEDFERHDREATQRAKQNGTDWETEIGMVVAEHAASKAEAARDAQEDR